MSNRDWNLGLALGRVSAATRYNQSTLHTYKQRIIFNNINLPLCNFCSIKWGARDCILGAAWSLVHEIEHLPTLHEGKFIFAFAMPTVASGSTGIYHDTLLAHFSFHLAQPLGVSWKVPSKVLPVPYRPVNDSIWVNTDGSMTHSTGVVRVQVLRC